MSAVAVYLEEGSQRVFAGALEWPGWIRSGKDEGQALAALATVAKRYSPVARSAGFPLPATPGDLEVVERIRGNATTDFGAPGLPAQADRGPLSASEAGRLRALLEACWTALDKIVAEAPAELRKGPRGGGRDRDAIVAHVLGAEAAYAPKLGLRLKQPPADDAAAVAAFRAAILAGLDAGEGSWPPRYAARRFAWHVLDHAWEIEDRTF